MKIGGCTVHQKEFLYKKIGHFLLKKKIGHFLDKVVVAGFCKNEC
jgi:hypothetical protein